MEVQNPYAPPAAQPTPARPPSLPATAVPPPPLDAMDEAVDPELFAPSTSKLVAMSLCTFGLYVPYWFFRNWQCIRDQEGLDIWPFWRALFAPLWSFSCLAHLSRYASSRKRQLAFSPTTLALSYFLLNFVGNLLMMYSARWVRIGFLLALFAFLPLLPMNSLMRDYMRAKRMDLRRNDRLLVWHILIILFGGLLLLLAVAGMFVGRHH